MRVSIVDPSIVKGIGLGGTCSGVNRYEKGALVGPLVLNGGEVRRMPIQAIIEGYDLADVVLAFRSSTPFDEVPAGALYGAEGEVTLDIRADAREGFNGGPRGSLVGTLYVERLVPLGSVLDALARGAQPQHRKDAA